MRKRRYETLLPLKYNDGRPIDEDLFEQTREELVAQFGGLCVQFFVSFKATLLERFEQIEIYVASFLVDIL